MGTERYFVCFVIRCKRVSPIWFPFLFSHLCFLGISELRGGQSCYTALAGVRKENFISHTHKSVGLSMLGLGLVRLAVGFRISHLGALDIWRPPWGRLLQFPFPKSCGSQPPNLLVYVAFSSIPWSISPNTQRLPGVGTDLFICAYGNHCFLSILVFFLFLSESHIAFPYGLC